MLIEIKQKNEFDIDKNLKFLQQLLICIKKKDIKKINEILNRNSYIHILENKNRYDALELNKRINEIEKITLNTINSKIHNNSKINAIKTNSVNSANYSIDGFNWTEVENIQRSLFSPTVIERASFKNYKFFFNYKQIEDKLLYDINWYKNYITNWTKELKELNEILGKIGEGLNNTGIPIIDSAIAIKNAIELGFFIINEIGNKIQDCCNLYYAKIIPYFLEMLNLVINSENVTKIYAFMQYSHNFARNETYGIWYTIINKNFNQYHKLLKDEMNIANHIYWENYMAEIHNY
ncbi:hypothetical protein PT312_03665 [Metamycoplasma hyosynoviae]|uniref:hypothetical protein n=1 Tax=Metamycoplasma hyosynoviae TaxID=29559 RepID=UPI0023615BBD|nr:hypothetical protein [Metamycoplasma hyosynoviae]MDD1377355.1 hypothetical protein [Metamycoplasma hyosynoviae]